MTPIEGGPKTDGRRIRLRPDSPMNELMRGQKAGRDEVMARRQDRFFRRPPEDPDVAALRQQAAANREESASLRRRAEAARKRAGLA